MAMRCASGAVRGSLLAERAAVAAFTSASRSITQQQPLQSQRQQRANFRCLASSRPQIRMQPQPVRSLSTEASAAAQEPREEMQFDVVIVGAGPAGLSAAIRLKQNAAASNQTISVCVVEKGGEVGAHIISGNVFEPRALDELFSEWRSDDTVPVRTPVTNDQFLYLISAKHSIAAPAALIPPSLQNHGNYIISLSEFTRWLATKAEALGVEIYPGFSASELLYNSDNSAVIGIATSDMGVDKQQQPKDTFTRGMSLLAHQTMFAEGCRGSLSELVMSRFQLRAAAAVDPQTYGLGLKEVWKLSPAQAARQQQGTVIHTVGWPAPSDTYSGCFLYYLSADTVQIGAVVGLDYSNPYLNPYQQFQQWKTHPAIAAVLADGQCMQYGARALNEGGLQSIPKLSFPGGMLIGCSAGFLNVPKIKGSHTAMKSGMLAADAVFEALMTARAEAAAAATATATAAADLTEDSEEALLLSPLRHLEVSVYESNLRSSWIHTELHAVRNYHPSFHALSNRLLNNTLTFLLYSAATAWIFRGREPWTFRNHNKTEDWQRTAPLSDTAAAVAIVYPKPDNVLTFDILTNLQRSGVYHTDNQVVHLKVRPGMAAVPAAVSVAVFGAPETRFCPAKVYEYTVNEATQQPTLVINSQNCVHCKTCAIKTPRNYIEWTVPEGGGGPKYANGM